MQRTDPISRRLPSSNGSRCRATGTPLAQLRRRDVWLAYGQALADGVSLRKAAIARDCSTATTDQILPDLKAETIARALDPIVARDALLVSDGAACSSYRSFANGAGILHVGLNTSAGERRWGVYHIQNVNAYAGRLKQWLRRFRGVATRYLPSYLGWRRMIDREGDRLTACFCIATAAEHSPRST